MATISSEVAIGRRMNGAEMFMAADLRRPVLAVRWQLPWFPPQAILAVHHDPIAGSIRS